MCCGALSALRLIGTIETALLVHFSSENRLTGTGIGSVDH